MCHQLCHCLHWSKYLQYLYNSLPIVHIGPYQVCVCVCVYHCMVSHDVTISSVTSSLFLDVHVPYLTSKKSDDAGKLLYSVYI